MKLTATLIFTFILALQTVQAQDLEIGDQNPSKLYVKLDPEKGKYFSHVVKAKETLYGLSKKYHTSIEDIYELNFNRPGLIIQPGTELFIPFNDSKLITSKSGNQNLMPISYVVQAQENIYRISKVYFNQGISQMKSRNGLENLNLSIHQELHIGWFPIGGMQKIAPPTDLDKEEILRPIITKETKENEVLHAEKDTLILELKKDSLNAEEAVIDTVDVAKKNELFTKKDTLQKVRIFRSQKGIAMWNKNSVDKENLYAMHKTAKINSLIEIYNPLLKRKAFAKVIGHIAPGLYPNDISLIITPRVAESLGMKDKRFRVEMKFYE